MAVDVETRIINNDFVYFGTNSSNYILNIFDSFMRIRDMSKNLNLKISASVQRNSRDFSERHRQCRPILSA